MFNEHQKRMYVQVATEVERHTAKLDHEFAKYSEAMQETEKFSPIISSFNRYGVETQGVFKLLQAHTLPHPAVFDHAFDRMNHAFGSLIQQFSEYENTGKTDSELATLIKTKQHALTEATKEEPAAAEPEEPKAEPEEDAAPVAEEAPAAEPEAPGAEPEAKADAEPTAEAAPELVTHTENLDKPCELTKDATGGQCHTVNEAIKLAGQSGLRVEHLSKKD